MTRKRLLGLPIDPLSMVETLDVIEEMISEGGHHQHVVVNASKVVEAQTSDVLQEAIEDCDIVNADGMSVVWAGRILGVPIPERVAGIDLMEGLLERAARRGWPVYFLGARPEVVALVARIEAERHRGLIVSGWQDGYWSAGREAQVMAAVVAADPVILFVAMPSPRKEQLVARYKEQLQVPFVMGVGGSFDVIAGVAKRAPTWAQRSGLGWAFRLIQEPRRMFKRYLVGNTKFVALVLRHLVRRGRRNNRP